MQEEEWKEQFRSKVEEQFGILKKLPYCQGTWIEIENLTMDYFEKGKTDIHDLLGASGKGNVTELAWMAMYLWEYEGNFTFCINFLCFLLVSNGHDLYERKYVKTFEEIERVGTYAKTNFLVAHGMTMFDESQNPDIKEMRELRNSIAHYKFKFEENRAQKKHSGAETEYQDMFILPIHGKLLSYVNEMRDILWSFIFEQPKKA